MSRSVLTVVPAQVEETSSRTESVAERVRRLQEEARMLAREQVEALERAIENLAMMADEIAKGGDAYPVGVRELSARMAEDLPAKAQSIRMITLRN
jgi:hypothetical protein